VVTLVSSEAESRGVCLHLVPADVPQVHGDPEKLRQAFLNLILNGVQATARGGSLTISAAPIVDGEDALPFVRISFADTGEGMAPDDLERIFEPFYTTKEGGTGLGLAITQRIVESHGGRIEVESGRGKGTVFRILLPV